jgi:nucleoside-diphosphate-sugar epimerase
MRWFTNDIATGAYEDVSKITLDYNTVIFDVRDLVDKIGNPPRYIISKVEQALLLLNSGKKIIICCDYGMSRSNSLAVAVISQWKNIPFAEAVELVKSKIDGAGIKIEMLNTVYEALHKNKQREDSRKNVLITGASGFIGRHLLSAMAGSKRVFAPGSSEINLRDNSLSLDLYVKANNIGVLIHLANPKIFTTNNSLGDALIMLKNVIDVCRTNNVKIVYPSGWEIYSGYKSGGLLADESLAPNPKGTYGETKWFSESLIRQYGVMYGLRYQIIRSGPLYGAGGEKPKFVYNFLDKARLNKEIYTHKYINGSPLLDLTYIDDYTKAISVISSHDFEGDINIGTGFGVSTFDIAKMICELTGSSSEIKQVVVEDHSPNIIMDSSFALQRFGWKAVTGIKEGLNKIINQQ